MNLGDLLTHAAARAPGRRAVTAESLQLTYAELNARVDALAAALTGLGLGAGDRVVLWMRNCPEFIESFFACWKLGLVAVPVNPRLRGVDVAFHATDSDAAALVHSPEFADGAAEVEVAHRIGTGGGGSYDALVAAHAGAADQTRAVADDAPAWLFYTSGTTGRPKGAVLTHGNLTFVVVSWCADLFGIQPEDVVLHCAPLSHGAGFHALTAVARGAENVVLARSDPARSSPRSPSTGSRRPGSSPPRSDCCSTIPSSTARDLSSLVSVIYGGAPMYRSDLVEAIERIGPVFCQLYGQGESPMTITYLRSAEHRPDSDVLTSAGIARTGMEVRIADADDRVLAANEVGEIQVRGPAVMAGYWGRPEASAEALRGGWLHTGDIGRLDERGYLHVLDRLKDMIITGGSNVYAREVEDVLLRHPGVHDAAVFGTPDRLWGEAVTAVVVGTPDAAIGAEEVQAFCREHLADYMRPKHVHVADGLPRNSYGKVLKRELRARYTV